ncbi:MAG: hypothetical protein LBU78_05395 [Microbacterium sp.]|jgi:hypothetical protein|nr:hypothetical protein [Microbacterium sp.]
MGDTARPIPERLEDQIQQAQHLTRTNNGPTVANEAEQLAAVHGPADMAGFYTSPEADVDDQDESDVESAADDAPAGGEPA